MEIECFLGSSEMLAYFQEGSMVIDQSIPIVKAIKRSMRFAPLEQAGREISSIKLTQPWNLMKTTLDLS